MDAAAVAALAAAVDHVHAAALNELLLQCQQLKEERDQLLVQRAQLRGDNMQLRGGARWTLRDLRMGEVETAEQRLAQEVEDSDDSD